MSRKIHILSKQLSNQIAAGEVVERPLSVVKELIENSLDAGATEIQIRLLQGGTRYIEVQDNGEGVSREDMEIILEKYATSKIANIQDLYNVMTFGFRGEALSSISSVSEFTLISKTNTSVSGYQLYTQGGDGVHFTEVASDVGTTIRVENLFFNTPARLSYLKKHRTEYVKIYEYVTRMSFIYPQVSFTLFHEEKQIFSFPKQQKTNARIYEVFGNDVYENLVPVKYEFDGISITGFITDPKVSFQNKNRQVISINNRLIQSPIISKAISDAYNRFISHGTYPSYVIFISLDPTQVDVNVHPRKMELRFSHEAALFRSVFHSVKDELEKVSLVTASGSQDSNYNADHRNIPYKNNKTNAVGNERYYTGSGTKFKNYSPYKDISSNPAQHAINFSSAMPSKNGENIYSQALMGRENASPIGKIIGQIHNSYIVVETTKGIQILDQHALAERVIYEKLAKKGYKSDIQRILGGISIQLHMQERDTFEEYKEVFQDMGFEIELFSGGNIMIYGVPNFVGRTNIEKLCKQILGDISEIGSKSFEEIQHKIWAYTACRSAVKFGDPLSMYEMKQLLIDASLDYSATCPHGRPVIWEVGLDELQKKYER